jgi:hypothetical protein
MSAQSAKLGEAFFLLRKSPTGNWGFAFGVACLTTKPSELPEVGRYLGTRFDFLTIETAFFIIASTPFRDFIMPGFPGLKDFPMQVNTGAAMGAVVDFAATAATADAAPSDPNSPDANRQKISNLNVLTAQIAARTDADTNLQTLRPVDPGACAFRARTAWRCDFRRGDRDQGRTLAVTLEGSVAFLLDADSRSSDRCTSVSGRRL